MNKIDNESLHFVGFQYIDWVKYTQLTLIELAIELRFFINWFDFCTTSFTEYGQSLQVIRFDGFLIFTIFYGYCK